MDYYQNLIDKRKSIENGWKDVQGLLEIINANKDIFLNNDKSEYFINTFYSDSKKVIENIKNLFEKMDEQYIYFLNILGESFESMELSRFIKAFQKFMEKINESIKKYKK